MQDQKTTSKAKTPAPRSSAASSRPALSEPSPEIGTNERLRRNLTAAAPMRKVSSRRPLYAHPAMIGLIFLGAGCFVWSIVLERRPQAVPPPWQESLGSQAPTEGFLASVRSAGPEQGQLLRLEWPAHPRAASYEVQFTGANGFETSAIPVLGNVFMYDLKSDVFQLPQEFRWNVTAVMADGTESTSGSSQFKITADPAP